MNRGSGETIGPKIHIPSPLENSGERHSNRSINLRSPVHWLIRSGDAGESQLRYFEGPSGPKPDKVKGVGRRKSRAEPTWTAASFALVVGGPAGFSLMFGLLSLCSN